METLHASILYRLLVLSSLALSIQGQVIGSVTSRISYAVPRTEGGLVGVITVDVQPVLGSSVAINTSSALQWGLHTGGTGKVALVSSAVRAGPNQLLAQLTSLWALSSNGEYGGDSFSVTATESVSSFLVDSVGEYSFNDSKNW